MFLRAPSLAGVDEGSDGCALARARRGHSPRTMSPGVSPSRFPHPAATGERCRPPTACDKHEGTRDHPRKAPLGAWKSSRSVEQLFPKPRHIRRGGRGLGDSDRLGATNPAAAGGWKRCGFGAKSASSGAALLPRSTPSISSRPRQREGQPGLLGGRRGAMMVPDHTTTRDAR